MPLYNYDNSLSFAENKRRAIEAHERLGPMMPVIVGDEKRGDSYVSHYLFPTGATLEAKDPKCMIQEPYNPLYCLNELEHREQRHALLQNVKQYWTLRLKQAEEAFETAKADAVRYPSEEKKGKLLFLSAEVRKLRQTLTAAEQALLPPTPRYRELTAEELQQTAQRAAERQRLETDIASIIP